MHTQCQNCGEITPTFTPVIGGNSQPKSLPAGTVVELSAGEYVMLMHATLVEAVEVSHGD